MNIEFKIKTSIFWDKKAKCWVIYSKKYDISSYGKTKKQAKYMFKQSVLGILSYTAGNYE